MRLFDFLRPTNDESRHLGWLGFLGILGFSGFQNPLGFAFFSFLVFFSYFMVPRLGGRDRASGGR